jgi:hypothetical protein
VDVVAHAGFVTMRNYLSTHHLYAARYAAEAAAEREAAVRKPGIGVFDMRHRGYVLGAITESVAFMEAAVNELFQDAADGKTESLAGLPDCVTLLALDWRQTDGRKKTLDKYNFMLASAGKQPLPADHREMQGAAMLVRLRNYVVHYQPDDVSTETPHRIGKTLEGLFPPNALMVDAGNPWFPDKTLGAGCAEWAWRSARRLTEAFARELGLRLNYQVADFGDPLPT